MSDFTAIQEYVVENISRPVKYIIYKLKELIRVTAKFMSRSVPTGAASGYANIEKVEGNTVKFNQLVKNGKFSSSQNWAAESGVTTSIGDNVINITKTSSSNIGIYQSLQAVANHIYYVTLDAKSNASTTVRFTAGGSNLRVDTLLDEGVWTHICSITTTTSDTNLIYIYQSGTPTTLSVTNVQLFDLTAIFGAGNEPTTVAEYEQWRDQNGLPSVADYNAGELLSVKMSGMQTNTSRLPLGYQELEYLQGNGNTRIVPGVTINSNLKVEIEYEIITAGWLFGGTIGNQGRWGLTSLTTFYSGTASVNISDAVNPTGKNIAIFNYRTGAIVNNVNIPFSTVQTYGNVTTKNFYIFTADGTSVNTQEHKIYYTRIYTGDTLVRNFIPAKRLFDNVLGMYDTVSNTFFTNSGTGTFIGGPEVHLDTLPFDTTTFTGLNSSTNTREIMFSDGLNRTADGESYDYIDVINDEAEKNTIILPAEYTELEYIESSDGSQYIDTGIKLMGTYTINTEITSINNTGNFCVFGASNGTLYSKGEISLFWYQAEWDRVIPTSNSVSVNGRFGTYLANTHYNITYDKTKTQITDGVNTYTNNNENFYENYVGTKNLYLMAVNRGSALYGGMFKIHCFSILDGDSNIILNLIPAKNNSNVVGMFDLVSKTFFTNSGTGDFVAGPVVVKNVYPLSAPITYTDLRDRFGNKLNGRYKVESGGTENILPQNTSTPISVAPIITTTYNKES